MIIGLKLQCGTILGGSHDLEINAHCHHLDLDHPTSIDA